MKDYIIASIISVTLLTCTGLVCYKITEPHHVVVHSVPVDESLAGELRSMQEQVDTLTEAVNELINRENERAEKQSCL